MRINRTSWKIVELLFSIICIANYNKIGLDKPFAEMMGKKDEK